MKRKIPISELIVIDAFSLLRLNVEQINAGLMCSTLAGQRGSTRIFASICDSRRLYLTDQTNTPAVLLVIGSAIKLIVFFAVMVPVAPRSQLL